MKSEHRHDLQTNDLGKLMGQAEPFVEKYGMKILAAIGGIFVLLVVLVIWNSKQNSQASEGWTRLAAAGSTEDFENVAEDFAGSPVADWALIHAAESHLQSGIRSSFTDRSAGDRELKDAREQFQQLLDSASVPAEIRERALFGMARVEETTSDGDLKTATELYKKLISEFPESVFRQLAEQRVKPVDAEKVAALDQEGTKEFYKWFHEQNPKPGDRQRPGFNMPMPGMAPQGAAPQGGAPAGGETTPGLPALPSLPSLPGLPEPLTSEEGKTSKSTPATPEKTETPAPAKKPAPETGKAPAEPTKAEQPKTEAPKPEPAPEKKP
ncbi:hypothetical protein Pan153_30000 [Gimesia panareensis]|uniref:Tetratricopeptide repeat-like domain-containing protein n=1 Tax=Gimesia panareensis TaxID=2527978 RepID=A0A518FPR8_9PLAN|nr:hypothetical protein [Gimesia panareensis]QDV18343.1 hypothetical protein Pan153_30000 [Gimesia panareensis]